VQQCRQGKKMVAETFLSSPRSCTQLYTPEFSATAALQEVGSCYTSESRSQLTSAKAEQAWSKPNKSTRSMQLSELDLAKSV